MSVLRPGSSHHMTETICENLNKIGIKTVSDFVVGDTEEISRKSEISYKVSPL